MTTGRASSIILSLRTRMAGAGGAVESPDGGGQHRGATGATPQPDRYAALRSRLLAALQPPLELYLSPQGVLEWPDALYPFQIQGVRLLLERDSILLADEMGLGKTIQALAALRLLALRGDVERCLVVVPAGLLRQWRDQFGRWAPELRLSPITGNPEEREGQWMTPAHAYLVGYETLRSDVGLARQKPWDLVVIDEAQRIKNADAEVSLCVKRLPRRRAWSLTGTPLENRLEDLASILEFTRPRSPDAAPPTVRPTPGLRQVLDDLQLRRRKQDVLRDLPPKTATDLRLSMGARQRRAYERAENEGIVKLRASGPMVPVSNVLELILRLKQLCNFDPEGGGSVKADDLLERIEQLCDSGHKALVFSQFIDSDYGVGAIIRRLAGLGPLALTGSMSQNQREDVVRRFNEDPRAPVLVLSLRAGGVGLNLQAASYVFHFDRWWNPAVEDQATDRSHRLGQVRPVHVYAYAIENSVEERILEILETKRLLFSEIVEGAGIDVGTSLTKEELLRVAGLPSSAAITPASRRV